MTQKTLTFTALVAGLIGLVLGAVALFTTLNSSSTGLEQVVFEHDAMTSDQITLVPSSLPDSTIGEKRYYNVPATNPEGGSFTGTLTVMAENTPEVGKDIRETSLVFQMGSIEDQIQIGGVAVYDMANPALKEGQVIVRPILGGTGKYAKATGWVQTKHNEDGTWTHTIYYTK